MHCMYFFSASEAVLTIEALRGEKVGEGAKEANDQTDKHLRKEEEVVSGQKSSLLLEGTTGCC